MVTKIVLAVEGKDEENFFKALLKHMGIDGCGICDVGGKDQFSNKLSALKKNTTNFKGVQFLGIIRDAEESAENTFQTVIDILEKLKLPTPDKVNQFTSPEDGTPAVGIYIMPGNADSGMLEYLCLMLAKDHRACQCVEKFIDDCAQTLLQPPKNIPKAKTQAYLAIMPEIVNSVGLGAQRGYWNFDSGELDSLRGFLGSLKVTNSAF
ncbi:DUF3226 domain-containing protein [Candidatus Magnetobacterium casense]|uniref:DUF3226 domain-containing protein n=1 Tax=Candidatus Magnetobacterium casense TaxID=1455061 RepID=UPI00058B292A|nr:DUF3226 domain-containing protein [Candidatus Magnetobacterium casensis]